MSCSRQILLNIYLIGRITSLWGSPNVNETVADTEEEMVAYCTSDKYGTRVLPPGALQGVQFIQTPDYVEIVGYIDQTALNLQADDYGGEEGESPFPLQSFFITHTTIRC